MPAHDKPESLSGFSRRGFLKTVGVGTVAGGLLRTSRQPAATAATTPEIAGPGPVPVKLAINGTTRKVAVEPRVTLLDALRNHLDLTGSKRVCDRGTCGACTVLLDGKPVYACSMLAVEAEGHDITTIEGLGTPEQLSVLQAGFVEHDAQQCGFCTPGFVVACTAFVREHPGATLEQVQAGLGGNLCRCGTYHGIKAAVVEAAKALKGGA